MRILAVSALVLTWSVTSACEPQPAISVQSSTISDAADDLRGIDEFINSTMKDWTVQGLAVAVSHDGHVIWSKGYGWKDVERQLPVTDETIFAIGSITKSVTVTGLGILVDEGKLDWDRPIRSIIPEFQLQDKVATEQMTIRDSVTHRSGLPRHDLVWYSDPSLTRPDLLRR